MTPITSATCTICHVDNGHRAECAKVQLDTNGLYRFENEAFERNTERTRLMAEILAELFDADQLPAGIVDHYDFATRLLTTRQVIDMAMPGVERALNCFNRIMTEGV